MKIAVIGCGNLATAVVSKLEGFEIHTYTPSFTKAAELAKLKSGTAHKSLEDIPYCDFVILGMKPQQFLEFTKEYKSFFNSKSTIISLLAGTDVQTIARELGAQKIARVMSNTPALIGEGLHALYFKDIEDQKTIQEMFKASGKVITLGSEDQIDAITHFSGSGPAYVFDMARALIKELVDRGLSETDARLAIAQTLYGSSKLLLESDLEAITLRKQVTSKAGVTEKVLESLWDSGFDEAWNKALKAGDKRISELKG